MTTQHGSYELYDFIAEYYDASYNRRNDIDVAFYVEYATKAEGHTLELACGTGRVLIPTAITGCKITGLDLSPYMLDKCRDKLAQQPPDVQNKVKLIQGDMTGFSTGEKYGLITMPFRPFQHLITVAQQKACLGHIHRHLKANGLLVFDVYNPNFARLVPNPQYTQETIDLPEMTLPDGRKLSRANRITAFHREQQYNEVELIYYVIHPDGKKERLVQKFPMRYFFRYEMEHLLELCGFKIVDFFGDFKKSAFTGDSPEMIFIAKKK